MYSFYRLSVVGMFWRRAVEGLILNTYHKLSMRPEDSGGRVRMRDFMLPPQLRWVLRPSCSFYRRFGTIDRSHQGSNCPKRPLKLGPIRFPGTSFTQYQSTLRKIREERRSQTSGCLQSQPAFELAATSDITAWVSLSDASSDITAWTSLCGAASDITAANLCDASSDVTV